jgi:hypothetical protein
VRLGRARLRPQTISQARTAFILVATGLLLGGCGNCGGWTYPWYKSGAPHSCGSDQPSQEAATAPVE